MELVNTLFASLAGTDPFTGVDITIANCKSAYWDEGIVQQLINQVLDEGEKTAFEVASKSTWSTGGMPWKQLPPHIQRVAVSEALAHLDLLLMQGLVVQEHTNGLCLYRSKRM